MNIILKNFKENLINNHKVTQKIANVRIKKIEKILENNCLIEKFTNLEDLNTKITPKIKEIIIEEIEEIKKEKNIDIKEIHYLSIFSERKHIIDVFIKDESTLFLLSFEIFAKKENISIEFFENIQEKNLSTNNSSISFINDENKQITKKYVSFENSHVCFEIIKNNNDEFILKNAISENKIVLNELEYNKLYLD